MALEILIGLPLLLLVGGYFWYMSLIGRRNKALEALSSIDVQLRKRHDLVPNILTIAQKFMDHEKELLTELTALRSRLTDHLNPKDAAEFGAQMQVESALQGLMGRFFAVAENYPDLKSDKTMLNAQHTYQEVEGHIAASRRFYNSAVTDLNNAVQIWPGSMIAAMASVTAMPYFEIEDPAVKAPVNASDYLK